jgi:hypothetical protein
VRYAPTFARLVGRCFSGRRGLAIAAPAWELHAHIVPAVSLAIGGRRGDASPVGEVLPLLLLPWELHACVVSVVCDAPTFARSVGRRLSGWRGLAVAAPAWELHTRVVPAVLAFAHSAQHFSGRRGLAIAVPAWELRVRRAHVHDVLAFARSAWAMLLCADRAGGWRGLAMAAPALGAPGVASIVRVVVACGQPACESWLSAGDTLSAQIAHVVNEVVQWLLPPWELRAPTRVMPAVSGALAFGRLVVIIGVGVRMGRQVSGMVVAGVTAARARWWWCGRGFDQAG